MKSLSSLAFAARSPLNLINDKFLETEWAELD